MKVNDVLKSLISTARDNLDKLLLFQGKTFQEYASSWETRYVVERGLQNAIQACIDLGARLISLKSWPTPEGYHHVFDTLIERGVISPETGAHMKRMVGLRNALVHEYREIHHEAVFDNLRNALKGIESYLAQALAFIERSPES